MSDLEGLFFRQKARIRVFRCDFVTYSYYVRVIGIFADLNFIPAAIIYYLSLFPPLLLISLSIDPPLSSLSSPPTFPARPSLTPPLVPSLPPLHQYLYIISRFLSPPSSPNGPVARSPSGPLSSPGVIPHFPPSLSPPLPPSHTPLFEHIVILYKNGKTPTAVPFSIMTNKDCT